MKCSKCGYLGFEAGERCRNCGYEFSLAQPYELPDLAIRASGADGALPLFVSPLDDDTPMITKPSPPRAPLSVRRTTPDAVRLRGTPPKSATAELALELRPSTATRVAAPPTPPIDGTARRSDTAVQHQDAAVSRRLLAGVLDLLILLAVDIVVVYFTMQICGVTLDELELLPKGPLVVFLLVQNIGYLVAFTAGGQTLGKMAAGIKVIAGDCDGSLDVGCALKRTMLSLLLAVPAGLGLLPALFDPQHRGLHDRFAGTRVVRATA
jgi:uncharacterized RDD family membrane protein YckC